GDLRWPDSRNTLNSTDRRDRVEPTHFLGPAMAGFPEFAARNFVLLAIHRVGKTRYRTDL
ncbi:MAG: hypothetical protein AAB921_02355, partial [Patescibacteria group bacterium]